MIYIILKDGLLSTVFPNILEHLTGNYGCSINKVLTKKLCSISRDTIINTSYKDTNIPDSYLGQTMCMVQLVEMNVFVDVAIKERYYFEKYFFAPKDQTHSDIWSILFSSPFLSK